MTYSLRQRAWIHFFCAYIALLLGIFVLACAVPLAPLLVALFVAPALIVEVMSPNDRSSEVMRKLREYFSIGVRLVWVADPDAQIVYAYRSVTDVREFSADQMLLGDDVLPQFSVQVARFFEE